LKLIALSALLSLAISSVSFSQFTPTVYPVKKLRKALVDSSLVGKMILVKGTVFDMNEGDGPNPPWIILSYSYTEAGMKLDQGVAKCYFVRDLPELKRGQVVTIKGKCNGESIMYVEIGFTTIVSQ
jgi:hypothetical protein